MSQVKKSTRKSPIIIKKKSKMENTDQRKRSRSQYENLLRKKDANSVKRQRIIEPQVLYGVHKLSILYDKKTGNLIVLVGEMHRNPVCSGLNDAVYLTDFVKAIRSTVYDRHTIFMLEMKSDPTLEEEVYKETVPETTSPLFETIHSIINYQNKGRLADLVGGNISIYPVDIRWNDYELFPLYEIINTLHGDMAGFYNYINYHSARDIQRQLSGIYDFIQRKYAYFPLHMMPTLQADLNTVMHNVVLYKKMYYLDKSHIFVCNGECRKAIKRSFIALQDLQALYVMNNTWDKGNQLYFYYAGAYHTTNLKKILEFQQGDKLKYIYRSVTPAGGVNCVPIEMDIVIDSINRNAYRSVAPMEID